VLRAPRSASACPTPRLDSCGMRQGRTRGLQAAQESRGHACRKRCRRAQVDGVREAAARAAAEREAAAAELHSLQAAASELRTREAALEQVCGAARAGPAG